MYTYEQVIDKIEHARRFGRQPGVEVTARALEVLGHPEAGLPFVHVAGTNGKGSVCAFLGSILREAGKKAGVFTSPHLIDFEERIVVNGRRIPKEDVVRLGNRLLTTDFGVELTMFDYCLLMAVLYFKECGCDIAVMETGLGGRLDSTNALGLPEVAVITRIGYDHMAILGHTLSEIAAEKAGILKPGCKFVMGLQEPEAEAVLLQAAENPERESDSISIYRVSAENIERMRSYHMRMIGEYQLENAAIAEQTARLLLSEPSQIHKERETLFFEQSKTESKDCYLNGFQGESKEDDNSKIVRQEKVNKIIRKGIEQAVWPGRMQILSESPFLLVDGAHNSNGVAALRHSLEAAYPGEKFHFLMGVMEDKDYTQMVEMMLPLAIDFVTVTPQSQRALAARDLAAQIRARGVPAQAAGSVKEALRSWRESADERDRQHDRSESVDAKEAQPCRTVNVHPVGSRTVAFGSLYFIGELCSVSGKLNFL